MRYLRNLLQLEWRHWWRHEWCYQAVAELDAALVDCLNAAGAASILPNAAVAVSSAASPMAAFEAELHQLRLDTFFR